MLFVGGAFTRGGRHAFLWQNGRMIGLNNLIPTNSGWELEDAYNINNKGQIVGQGIHNGKYRSFLLTPTWVIQ
jgi:probable HAF family extracellular repeat protein